MRLQAQDIPNIISILRLLAVGPVVALIFFGEFGWALSLFAVAGLSDGLDGFLARRFSWHSRIGGILDPLADKALLVSSFLALGFVELVPPWLVAAAVLRDLFIVVGATVYNYRIEVLRAAPTMASKLNTAIEIALITLVLADAGPFSVPVWILETLVWTCLGTILVSGSQYAWTWYRKAAEKGWRGR